MFLVICLFNKVLTEYTPTVFIYGMGSNNNDFDEMRRWTEEMYPGMYTTSKRIGYNAEEASIFWSMSN